MRVGMGWAPTVLALAFAVNGGGTDQGRIPIYQPVTITEPGSYVLTRNLTVTGIQAITVDANDVTIDLNGHVISGDTTVVRINANRDNVVIQGGSLVRTIGSQAVLQQLPSTSEPKVTLKHVAFRGGSVELSGADAVITECTFVGGRGLRIMGKKARVTHNQFGPGLVDTAMRLTDVSGAEIANNYILGGGVSGVDDIYIAGHGTGNRIVDNAIQQGSGFGIRVGDSNLVEGNVITDSRESGIWIGSGNLLVNNVVARSNDITDAPFSIRVGGSNTIRGNHIEGTLCNDGIYIEGSNNLLEDNVVHGLVGGCDSGKAAALRFLPGADDNAYRNNQLRGNVFAVFDDGVNNTDAGGNIE